MRALAIGLVYELRGARPRRVGEPPDFDAEYEPEATLLALESALRDLGHDPVRVGTPHDLLARAGKGDLPALDAALSIAEGYGTRNREAWAPVLLEMLGIPQLGSDALTLSLTLDKAWTQDVVAAAGVPVAPHVVIDAAESAGCGALPSPFPLFVKPRWEGTAKGIGRSSRVEDRAALAREVRRIHEGYRQAALVEAFLEGPEYTVTVVGHDPPRSLPALQRALDRKTGIGWHALEVAGAPWLPGTLDAALEAQLGSLALRAFRALECRDFARADFKLDGEGRPFFLEMNPLPSFAPDGSFGILAELAGQRVEALLGEVLHAALRRLGIVP